MPVPPPWGPAPPVLLGFQIVQWLSSRGRIPADLSLPLANPSDLSICVQNRPGMLGQAEAGGRPPWNRKPGGPLIQWAPPNRRPGPVISAIPEPKGFLRLGCVPDALGPLGGWS